MDGLDEFRGSVEDKSPDRVNSGEGRVGCLGTRRTGGFLLTDGIGEHEN